jgi:hypothetical protein
MNLQMGASSGLSEPAYTASPPTPVKVGRGHTEPTIAVGVSLDP